MVFSRTITAAGQGDNILDNGGFENGDEPHLWAQWDHVDDWVDETDAATQYPDVGVHSADYFSTPFDINLSDPAGGNTQGTLPLASGARSGTRYAGLASYELIQQEISGLTSGNWYTISMWVRLALDNWSTWSGASELRVVLAKHRVRYSSYDYCSVPYTEYDGNLFQSIKVVGSEVLTQSEYPPSEGWKRISFTFYASDEILGVGLFDEAYTWLAIENRQLDPTPNGDAQWCYTDYLYIDDVSLEDARFCTSPCASSFIFQPIVITTYDHDGGIHTSNDGSNLPTEMIGNSTSTPFIFLVKYAMAVDLTVFSNWGGDFLDGPIYHQQQFNVNALHDSGYEDYAFAWFGHLDDGSHYEGTGAWAYRIRIWNCGPGNPIDRISYLTYGGWSNSEVQERPITSNGVFDSPGLDGTTCCEDHAYFQNQVFHGPFRKDVVDFIAAGSAVTSGQQGPVEVSSDANVLFHAGNQIVLAPGFSVAPGGVFHASISDCAYGSTRAMAAMDDRPLRFTGAENGDGAEMLVIPNPTRDGDFQVRSAREGRFQSIVLLDSWGRTCQHWDSPASGQVLHAKSLSAGLYHVLVRSIGGHVRTLRLAIE